MKHSIQSISGHPAGQRGIALAVVLILLLVITLLALASLRGTLLQERMSSNVRDRGLAFQAAEAALREGEAVAGTRPTPGVGCTNGLCDAPDPATAADNLRWSDANWEANSRAATVEVDGVPAAPRFMVELIQEGVPSTSGACTTSLDVSPDAACNDLANAYRITARSSSADRADVTLQSTYIVP